MTEHKSGQERFESPFVSTGETAEKWEHIYAAIYDWFLSSGSGPRHGSTHGARETLTTRSVIHLTVSLNGKQILEAIRLINTQGII